MISAIGLKEAKEIADEFIRIFRAATGFHPFGESYDLYGPDRIDYESQPRFMNGKLEFIKAVRDFSKEGVEFHSLREARQEAKIAGERVSETYQAYLDALDAAQTARERLAALESEETTL